MDYIERMKVELNELVEKGTNLDNAIVNLKNITDEERELMCSQLHIMSAYVDVLQARIKLAEEINSDSPS